MAWADRITNDDCKTICNGAIRSSISIPKNYDSKDVIFEKTIMRDHKTFYDRIYVRTYQPDCIKRTLEGPSPYLNNHLGSKPLKKDA
jgi:hypothetical protein